MPFLSQPRRRQKYSILVACLLGLVTVIICTRLLSDEEIDVAPHDHHHHHIHKDVPHAVSSKTTLATKLITAKESNFSRVRRNESSRRFISTAVESLIQEIKMNVKNQEIAWLFENCFPNTLDTTVDFDQHAGDGKRPDTYVITGDIDAMWLRDSSAQVNPYLPLMRHDPKLRQLIEGVLLRQLMFVERDPYANAHYKDVSRTSEWKHMDKTDMRPGVHERKWEVDSLCYVLRLMHSYWREVDQDLKFFKDYEQEFRRAVRTILQTFVDQQRFNGSGNVALS